LTIEEIEHKKKKIKICIIKKLIQKIVKVGERMTLMIVGVVTVGCGGSHDVRVRGVVGLH
jgi:hypothetical protein